MAGFYDGFEVDIVFVIDATSSMESFVANVKERVLTLGDEIQKKMDEVCKFVKALRVRVVDFADFATEGIDTIHASEFFTLPDEREQFEKYVRNIEYKERGGDVPENALEALWVAMKSDWVELSRLKRGRHIIVLITDAPPLHLGERIGCMGYNAEDYPENILEMEKIWNEWFELSEKHTRLHPTHSRLVLLAPECDDPSHSWKQVSEWGRTTFLAVNSDSNLKTMDLDGVIADFILAF